MNHVERFRNVMAFRPVDRLPMIEWAGWWDKTVARWYGEGLPAQLKDAGEIREYLGLDRYRQHWIGARAPSCPSAPHHGAGILRNMDDYRKLRPHLYPALAFDPTPFRAWGAEQKKGDSVVWLTLEGFFWFPRGLLGIEPHLYAFYDQPELMHAINRDLCEFNLRVIREFCAACVPCFMTFAEDLSYNHGPMLSKGMFDEFLAPYYRRVVPLLNEYGVTPMMDSDGDVTTIIPWLEDVGVEGLLPLERMAGVDVARIRADHPRFKMIGAFDKTVMHLGEAAMRREFERLLPVMRTGGYIASVDHQTPPAVSLSDYRLYVRLLKGYCERAARA